MLPRLIAISAAIVLVALAMSGAAPRLMSYVQPDQATPVAPSAAATAPAGAASIAIPAGSDGHFRADAVIDGHTVPVVIDTGTTTIALSAATARALGLRFTAADYTESVETANGTVRAARATLRAVSIGNVTVRDVMAVVLEGDVLEQNLLGMSFLNRLTKFEAGGGQLVLVQ
jgi:aspartyl protease family protein